MNEYRGRGWSGCVVGGLMSMNCYIECMLEYKWLTQKNNEIIRIYCIVNCVSYMLGNNIPLLF